MLVTKDGVNVHKQFSADEGISYTLLADPKANIIGSSPEFLNPELGTASRCPQFSQ